MKAGNKIKKAVKTAKKVEEKAISKLKTKASKAVKAEKKAVAAVKKTVKKAVVKAVKAEKKIKNAAKPVVKKAVKTVKKVEKKAVNLEKKVVNKAVKVEKKAKKVVAKVEKKVVEEIKKSVYKPAVKPVAKIKAEGTAADILTPAEIKEIEKNLLEMREEVQNRIRNKKEHEMPETEVGDEADIASQSLDKEVLFELNGNAQALLDQIESALRRISKGIYGTCEYCRCQIPKKRILALPFARYCIRCQASNEGIKR